MKPSQKQKIAASVVCLVLVLFFFGSGSVDTDDQKISCIFKNAEWPNYFEKQPLERSSKYEIIKSYGQFFHLSNLLETGTYEGQLAEAARFNFTSIITIELNPPFYEKAKKKFETWSNVHLLKGDSGIVLPNLFKEGIIKEPTLFWLDGHWDVDASQLVGEEQSPIIKEVRAILEDPLSEKHVMLIDDARLFRGYGYCKSLGGDPKKATGSAPCYPSLQEMKDLVCRYKPQWSFMLVDDIIRIHANHFPALP